MIVDATLPGLFRGSVECGEQTSSDPVRVHDPHDALVELDSGQRTRAVDAEPAEAVLDVRLSEVVLDGTCRPSRRSGLGVINVINVVDVVVEEPRFVFVDHGVPPRRA